jgi:very-short-patch-repair endonuclease
MHALKEASVPLPCIPLPCIGERIKVRGQSAIESAIWIQQPSLRYLVPFAMSRARYLRKNSTPCERMLWRRLRNRNFADHKFRRQHPIGDYILDFYCPEKRLAVELDGGGHSYFSKQEHDQLRDHFLAEQGIRVLRFYNCDVRENLDGVLEAIWTALEEQPERNPSPYSSPFEKGRGEIWLRVI